MFEFEDSSGFHDTFLSKYADTSGPILDLYISDSMQDMLDIDIRTEVATVVGGTNEFTSLINDLPSLDIESNSNDGDISWLGGPKWSATSDLYADVGACVNPNSVMPIITSSLLNASKAQINLNTTHYRPSNSPPPSPKESKSHLTFSPHQIKVPSIQEIKRPSQLTTSSKIAVDSIKKELITDFKEENPISKTISGSISTSNLSATNTIKLAPGIGGLTFGNSVTYTKLKHTSIKTSPSSGSFSNNIIIKKEKESSPLRHITPNTNNNSHILGNNSIHTSNKILSRGILIQSKNVPASNGHAQLNNMHHQSNNTNGTKNKPKPTGQEYPKPAYSYSCLIAMALKNSRSGSLPVSEIYNFMCEHFPYFKTAPNGWKNSVRHNLSLNKCFEKIEKPVTNGGQRKGCLWAMNPTKISKMDEEVQKWSRKDPMAIRKAMVYPEHLEALERGEMKHGSTGDSDGENEIQSDGEDISDSEQDNELDDTLMDTQESIDGEEDEDQEREYDVEVTDLYDTVEMDDNKESFRMTIQRNEIIDFGENEYSSSKRARLDVNYSIGPAGAFEQQMQQQQQQQQQQLLQQQQQQQQQHHHHQPTQHHSRRKMQLVNRII